MLYILSDSDELKTLTFTGYDIVSYRTNPLTKDCLGLTEHIWAPQSYLQAFNPPKTKLQVWREKWGSKVLKIDEETKSTIGISIV
jgi:hypothetical protein